MKIAEKFLKFVIYLVIGKILYFFLTAPYTVRKKCYEDFFKMLQRSERDRKSHM